MSSVGDDGVERPCEYELERERRIQRNLAEMQRCGIQLAANRIANGLEAEQVRKQEHKKRRKQAAIAAAKQYPPRRSQRKEQEAARTRIQECDSSGLDDLRQEGSEYDPTQSESDSTRSSDAHDVDTAMPHGTSGARSKLIRGCSRPKFLRFRSQGGGHRREVADADGGIARGRGLVRRGGALKRGTARSTGQDRSAVATAAERVATALQPHSSLNRMAPQQSSGREITNPEGAGKRKRATPGFNDSLGDEDALSEEGVDPNSGTARAVVQRAPGPEVQRRLQEEESIQALQLKKELLAMQLQLEQQRETNIRLELGGPLPNSVARLQGRSAKGRRGSSLTVSSSSAFASKIAASDDLEGNMYVESLPDVQRIIGKAISELFDDSERDGKLFMNDEDEIAIYAFEVLGDFADGQDQDGAQFLEWFHHPSKRDGGLAMWRRLWRDRMGNRRNLVVNAFLTVHNHPRPPRAQTGEEAATEAGFWSNVASWNSGLGYRRKDEIADVNPFRIALATAFCKSSLASPTNLYADDRGIPTVSLDQLAFASFKIKHLITSAGNKNAIQESHMEGYLAERELLKQELLKDGTKPTAINLVCCDEDLEDLLSGCASAGVEDNDAMLEEEEPQAGTANEDPGEGI